MRDPPILVSKPDPVYDFTKKTVRAQVVLRARLRQRSIVTQDNPTKVIDDRTNTTRSARERRSMLRP